jgi:hypothetical protein
MGKLALRIAVEDLLTPAARLMLPQTSFRRVASGTYVQPSFRRTLVGRKNPLTRTKAQGKRKIQYKSGICFAV